MTHAHDEDENELGWVTPNPQIEAKGLRAAILAGSAECREYGISEPHDGIYEVAIRAYLSASQEAAAPSEEPVAQWQIWVEDGVGPDGWVNEDAEMIEHWRSKGRKVRALFASPAVAPVAVSVKLAAKLESQAKILDGMAFKMRLPPGDNNLEDASAFMREAARILSSIIPAGSDMSTKSEGAIRGLERIKADFKMRGANATTIERAIDCIRTLVAALAQDTAATPPVAPTGTVGISDAMIRSAAEAIIHVKMPDGDTAADYLPTLDAEERAVWGISTPTFMYDRAREMRDDQLWIFAKILARAALEAALSTASSTGKETP